MRKFKSVEILRPFVRDSGFPLDATSLYYSYDEAVEYARSNPAAYAGQIIAVIDEDARKTNIYKVDYDPNKHYNFTLSTISVGSGASAFSFSGEVDTFSVESMGVSGVVDVESISDYQTVDYRALPEDAEDGATQLPENPNDGDVFYIAAEGRYVMAKVKDGEVEYVDYSQLPSSADDGECYLIDSTGEKLMAYHESGELRWRKPTELPDNPSAGDIYLVNDQDKLYVAYSHANSTEWKELAVEVHVDEVSKTQSGLMRHEAYSTLFNDTGKDALYFSRPEEQDGSDYSKTPDSNRWVEIDHTPVESGKDYKIPSKGTVSYMLNSAIRVLHEHPYAKATPTAATEYETGKRFAPEFDVVFRRQYSGPAISFRLKCASFVEGIDSYERVIGIDEMSYDENHQEYSYHFAESRMAYSDSPSSIEYSIEIDYYATDDEIDVETAKAAVEYHVKNRMYCGTYGDMTREMSSELAAEGGVLDLIYDPNEYEADGGYITGLYFAIPSSLRVRSIEYVQQHDVQALDYFKKRSDGGYDIYEYNLSGADMANSGPLKFESAGEYICRLN